MPHSDKFNGLLPSALGVCLLLPCAVSHAQGTNPQENGNITNPKECVQAEIAWTETRDSDANTLISDYFFSYPEGIKVVNHCDEDVSAAFGVDATLEGIVDDITSPGGGITNVETTSEEVLRCEPFTTFTFPGAKTNFLEFPESVRDTAERYHYERASHLGSSKSPGTEAIWDNLRWKLRYKGCIAWSDEAMKIGTGYRHRCGLAPCPGDVVITDYNVSGEVTQNIKSDQTVETKKKEPTDLEDLKRKIEQLTQLKITYSENVYSSGGEISYTTMTQKITFEKDTVNLYNHKIEGDGYPYDCGENWEKNLNWNISDMIVDDATEYYNREFGADPFTHFTVSLKENSKFNEYSHKVQLADCSVDHDTDTDYIYINIFTKDEKDAEEVVAAFRKLIEHYQNN